MTEKFIYYLVLHCITMETVTFKMQESVLKKVDRILRPLNFNTRTEFIREAIRDKLHKIETEKFMKRLAKIKGSATKKVSDEEFEKSREKAFLELAEQFDVKLE